ncbi:MAG: hypothetical protein Q9201_004666 [Fulgogasparrea decipioides]
MDEFAQTRAPDDLFDDDFTPIAESSIQELEQPPRQPLSQRGHGTGRSRGSRGRGGHPVQQQQQQNSINQPSATSPTDLSATGSTVANVSSATETDVTIPKPPSAVRGDRSATGGTAKPKLTEEELSARLAAAKLNNAKREAAHRLAEADEASFQQREAQASQRRQEEGRARRLMDQEREKNRLRKLGAQGGREWDEGKEDQPVDPRRSQFRRGAYGGAKGYQSSRDRAVDFQNHDNNGYGDRGYGQRGGRGRGGRGRGKGGTGRGGSGSRGNNVEILKPPVPTAETDFPALPRAKSTNGPGTTQVDGEQQQQPSVEVPAFQPPTSGEQSWADEVEGKVLSTEGEAPSGG